MSSLASVPWIIETGRTAIRDNHLAQILEVRAETQRLYDTIIASTDAAHNDYITARQKKSATPPSSSWTNNKAQSAFFSLRDYRLYAHYQRIYGLALFVACIFNRLLRSLSEASSSSSTTSTSSSPRSDIPDLEREAIHFVQEILSLAQDATIFRPLGASYVVLILIAAWIGTSDADEPTKMQIEAWLQIYGSDHPSGAVWQGDLPSIRRELEWIAQQLDVREYDGRDGDGAVRRLTMT